MNSHIQVQTLERAIWDLDLYSTAKMLLMRLITKGCHWATWTSKDTNKKLACDLGVTERSVRRAFNKLRTLCLVERSIGAGRAWTATVQAGAILKAAGFKAKDKESSSEEEGADEPPREDVTPRLTSTAAREIWNQHPMLPKEKALAPDNAIWPNHLLGMRPSTLYSTLDVYLTWARSGDQKFEGTTVTFKKFVSHAQDIWQWIDPNTHVPIPGMGRQIRDDQYGYFSAPTLENSTRKRRRGDRIHAHLADWLKDLYLAEGWPDLYKTLLFQLQCRPPAWLKPALRDRWGHLPIWQN